ncbi:conserved hypothetical protein [Culex quinquefasciatus]|uniref:Uncharacterized protein n=1 Tax=Culex quinquefasciatus TaxID=7176 RepID=B0XJQ8_CULQU|nr:conserved hypothetical protein [Culex quinquefasciatus]|eukprot:XP_001869880.1 conserved hypothetical protein [Culex quinquefasciatus]
MTGKHSFTISCCGCRQAGDQTDKFCKEFDYLSKVAAHYSSSPASAQDVRNPAMTLDKKSFHATSNGSRAKFKVPLGGVILAKHALHCPARDFLKAVVADKPPDRFFSVQHGPGLRHQVPRSGASWDPLSEELRGGPRKPGRRFTQHLSVHGRYRNSAKRPHTRFPLDDEDGQTGGGRRPPSSMPSARGLVEASIPKYLLYLNTFMRNFPLKNGQLLGDFLDTGLNSDL